MFEQGVARVAKINGKGRRLIQPPNNLYLNRDARTLDSKPNSAPVCTGYTKREQRVNSHTTSSTGRRHSLETKTEQRGGGQPGKLVLAPHLSEASQCKHLET